MISDVLKMNPEIKTQVVGCTVQVGLVNDDERLEFRVPDEGEKCITCEGRIAYAGKWRDDGGMILVVVKK